jgi:drug/metabolite transporter (DMT)-like permease
MKPTAYVLLLVGLALAATAVLLSRTPNPYSSAGADGSAEPWSSPALGITLLVAAGVAAALAAVMLRFGGKGYTETVSPPRR